MTNFKNYCKISKESLWEVFAVSGRKFRRGFFGYKKSDVYDYVKELDGRYRYDMLEKDGEIAEINAKNAVLQEKYDELQGKREVILSMLEKAHIEAGNIVSEAKDEAAKVREDAARAAMEAKINAEAEIEERKAEANREIEIKRRALRNMYETESRKIEHLRSEVVELRRNSLEAMRLFERELSEVEEKLSYREQTTTDAISDIRRGGRVEAFKDIKIPIKVIKRGS